MRYRDRVEIIQSILGVIKSEPSRKTNLMYRSSLSHNQLEEYLQLLETRGMIGSQDKAIAITPSGLDLLSLLDKVSVALGPRRGNGV